MFAERDSARGVLSGSDAGSGVHAGFVRVADDAAMEVAAVVQKLTGPGPGKPRTMAGGSHSVAHPWVSMDLVLYRINCAGSGACSAPAMLREGFDSFVGPEGVAMNSNGYLESRGSILEFRTLWGWKMRREVDPGASGREDLTGKGVSGALFKKLGL